ncbi:substrate-binding domain-containing protein [Haloprofundus halobius]|uniref:substrate-binding domain-containing protein n=1 Tax=Haloprofundus halobius TaxID=2876194 RepID=UPI001CCF7E30|nr:substrate-binding domain-containing protein [Haloprofundus halobius]
MKIQRRRFVQAAGVGAILGLSGCSSQRPSENADNSSGGNQSGGGQSDDGRSDGNGGNGQQQLTLATTTSTYDTGLLDELNPMFEAQFDARIKTIPQGTGAAIETGATGDADVILVHARGAEDEFLQQGHGVNRRDVMFNDFVIVGPEDDPAGIEGLQSATEAFSTIADAESTFVSRGDDSGTNKKELLVWEAAGVEPGGQWYRAVGKGMGDTLNQASQSSGYTIADRGTYLSMEDEVDLVIHVQGPLQDGPVILKNPYGVIPVNPAQHDNVNYELAMAYVGFLTSPEGQEAIDGYTANDSQLFFPNALSEEPQFGQYVPQGYSAEGSQSLSRRDKQYLYWVDRQVPADYQIDSPPHQP